MLLLLWWWRSYDDDDDDADKNEKGKTNDETHAYDKDHYDEESDNGDDEKIIRV